MKKRPLRRRARAIGKTDGSVLHFDIAKQFPAHTLTSIKDRPAQGAAQHQTPTWGALE
jgi:hypothetical protein